MTGTELFGKTIAILGMGRIGKEVAKRARAFDMNVKGYDLYWDEGFAKACNVDRCTTAEDALKDADVISLHMNLDEHNRGFINKTRIAAMKKGAIIINTARGGLVDRAGRRRRVQVRPARRLRRRRARPRAAEARPPVQRHRQHHHHAARRQPDVRVASSGRRCGRR